MPRFILIEPSLDKLGGHFHEYATEILKAAERLGHHPILAINQRFTQREHLPSHWQVFPVFPNCSASIHRVPRSYGFENVKPNKLDASGLRNAFYRMIDSGADRLKSLVNEFRLLRKVKRVNGFSNACEKLFDEIGFESDDQIFCSTMSDMDLLGLVKFLQRTPTSKKAYWHLQFHFRIYSGREPDYPRQDHSVERLRRRFLRALRQVTHHRPHFYTTTDHLAAQYQRLNVGAFKTLPWPVSTRFQRETKPAEQRGRLRVVCAGNTRREKGADHLRWLIDRLWEPLLKTEKLQLLFQADGKRRTQSMLGLPKDQVATSSSVTPSRIPDAPIVSVLHPLSAVQYAELIKTADVGLLLYNADEYYARCSGILVEFLAAGVPVIAPAGCWLGDEVDQANATYLANIAEHADTVRTWSFKELDWRSRDSNLQSRDPHRRQSQNLNIGLSPLATEFTIADSSQQRNLLVRFNWTTPTQGTYLRVGIEQYDTNQRKLAELTTIMGTCSTNVLFNSKAETRRVRLSLQNSYHDSEISVDSFRIAQLNTAEPLAAGFVGLTAADYQQVPSRIEEIYRNLDHYREAAQSFAAKWIEQHSPEKTIHMLDESSHRGLIGELRKAG